ncbi:MAG: hypothetical protein IPM17_16850 [Verrucomicrobia bacterium]|jgi:hypothetical protein|nr:hypothetical protein [Verrucomicrobiota bacterium]
MRRFVRILAVLVAVSAVAFWAATGANRGWTKTSVPVKTLDEITGIEAITYEDRFLPGVDFLGAAGVAAGLLVGVSFLFRKQTQQQQTVRT